MTREEAIDVIVNDIDTYTIREGLALNMAIKALEQEPKPMVEIDLYSVIKQKYIEREVLDKIIAEIKALSPEPTAYDVVDGNPIKDAVWETLDDVLQIIDKYKAETEET